MAYNYDENTEIGDIWGGWDWDWGRWDYKQS